MLHKNHSSNFSCLHAKNFFSDSFGIWFILFAALFFRIKLLGIYPLDADQSIFGLMALHILKGIDFPIFIYGCHYGGTLSSIIAAGFMKLFGISLFSLELGTMIESLIFVLITYFVGRQYFNKTIGLLAALMMAVPFPLLGHLCVKIGAYLFVTNVGGILLLYLHKFLSLPGDSLWKLNHGLQATHYVLQTSDSESVGREKQRNRKSGHLPIFAILGFLSGMAFWMHIPSTIYIFTFFTVLYFSIPQIGYRKRFITFVKSTSVKLFSLCFVVGASPVFLYNITHRGATILRFAGLGVTGLSRSKAENMGVVETLLFILKSKLAFFVHSPVIVGKFTLGLFCDENTISIITVIQIFAAILFLIGSVSMILKSYKNFKDNLSIIKTQGVNAGYKFISEDIIIVVNIYTFLFLALVGAYSIRHTFWFYSTIFITIAKFLYDVFLSSTILKHQTHSNPESLFNFIKPIMLLSLICFILGANLQGNFEAKNDRRNYNFEKLFRFLEKNKITRGFSGYEISYPVVFLSNEKIILSPSAGPDNIDRYPRHTDIVRKSDNPAYIFRADSLSDKKFEAELKRLKIKRKKDRVENFVVYYHLTKKILPEEVNIPRIF